MATGINPIMKGAFVQFSRNGRWGTCMDCPRDSNRMVYPEFCKNTNRYDHQLNVDQLIETHKRHLS